MLPGKDRSENRRIVRVGLASCGIAAGGIEVFDTLKRRILEQGLDIQLKRTGCMGMCYQEVLVEVVHPQDGSVVYGRVTPAKVDRIIQEHIVGGRPVSEWIVLSSREETADSGFMTKQKRIVLRNCGIIDPESIDDYIDAGGYQALDKVLQDGTPQAVIDEVTRSGLRGRGGAGFSTGTKWNFARQSVADQKYIICNADEGDPGAFMDRSVLESDPHSVIEGMMIAGYAIGASEGYIYVRAEYPMAVRRLEIAISQARTRGIVGNNVLGHDFSFNLKIRQGAGAFVCGEETALIMSIEGKRGMPRVRPPFPAQSGLWGKPTNINNVETLANVPWIILNGASAFNAYGTEKSKGTKVFALAGKIARSGLIEIPMGMTLGEIVNDIGGGTSSGLGFKAVQMGGPSGGILPASLADTPIDYESVAGTGAIVGSGGLIVMDESTCVVDVAKFFLKFTQEESCGKCTFCRIGTRVMLEILERISHGQGKEGDLETLEELAQGVKKASLCALGQTAPNPVLTTLKYFRDEYETHIYDKKCPSHKCTALISYEIISEKCRGCGLCARNCPVGAISGALKEPHLIDEKICVRCGLCVNACRFEAISIH